MNRADITAEKRKLGIETGFAAYPWLAVYLQKARLYELQIVKDIKPGFFLKYSDSFSHLEVTWLFDKNGAFLGEADDIKTDAGANIFSFENHYESMQEAIERVPGETFYILKNRNFTRAVLYEAPEGKSLRAYLHECIRTRSR
ncbi:MAG: hypothetical protein WC878_02360 [Candidatus Paceibacterota bacterium]|jgi:hypothetical protein